MRKGGRARGSRDFSDKESEKPWHPKEKNVLQVCLADFVRCPRRTIGCQTLHGTKQRAVDATRQTESGKHRAV